MPYNDLREFIEAARAIGDLKEIHGASWELEIGALTEIFAERDGGPLLYFDRIPGYPASYRVVSNLITHPRRSALAMGLSPDISRTELVARWKKILKELKTRLACGGTIKDGIIELQGNHKEKAKSILVRLGFSEEQIEVY